ncbi:hypothetical protein Nepgr_010995 [Nepenthes gracilis]|uniref:Uncharacterized protein n=1 Tax=Nepenthes gracilis TaxID=150966 RepID=A0AAD3SDA5_NEPGR|nr:hypothetical protein Nepgr_010995 [Nepenthes gracilis]
MLKEVEKGNFEAPQIYQGIARRLWLIGVAAAELVSKITFEETGKTRYPERVEFLVEGFIGTVACHGRNVPDILKREYRAQSEGGRRSEDLVRIGIQILLHKDCVINSLKSCRSFLVCANLSASSAAVEKLNDEFNHLLLKLQSADETITDRELFIEKWNSL